MMLQEEKNASLAQKINITYIVVYTDVHGQAEVFIEQDIKVYYRNSNKNYFYRGYKTDEIMKEVAA